MKAIYGYNAAKEATGEYQKLPAGGYVCKILKVEDVEQKEYLKITFDIYEGAYKGWYQEQRERLLDAGFSVEYVGTTSRSYKQSALGFFKAFINAVDESNGTNFGPYVEYGLDEQKLVGCLVGFVIGYEEYEKKTGGIGERERVAYQKAIQKIRTGDFKIPALKKFGKAMNHSQETSPGQSNSISYSVLNSDDIGLPF